MDLSSWLSEEISDLEKRMAWKLEDPVSKSHEIAYLDGRIKSLLTVEKFIVDQEAR